MRFKRLVAAGCSFTYGQGIERSEAWPAVLADKLGIECANLAENGASNSWIVDRMVDYAADHDVADTLFIPCFSHWMRMEFRRTDDNKMNFINPNWVKWTQFAKLLYEEYGHEPYLYKKYLNQILLLQGWFKSNDIEYLMFEGMNRMHLGTFVSDAHNLRLMKNIDRQKFFGFGGKCFDTWTDPKERLPDGHPNAAAHAQMADVLYQELINRYGER
jgi:hypothetical protein